MAKTSYIRRKKGVKENLPRFFLLIALVVFAMIFQGMQSNFLSLNNVMNLLAISSITGVLALGNMLLMSFMTGFAAQGTSRIVSTRHIPR